METKEVKLTRITTTVPKDAIRIHDLSELKEGDFILSIWDNERAQNGGIPESNYRLFSQVTDVSTGNISFGGYFDESKTHNATHCSFGSMHDKSLKAKYPKAVFKIREGVIIHRYVAELPNLKGNSAYDLMM
jgi:hypothetical protein